jgi:hypothetical protein
MTKEQCQEKIYQCQSVLDWYNKVKSEGFFTEWHDIEKMKQLKSYFETLLKVYDIQDESNNISPSTGIPS